jgi:hypothetical protein
MSVKFFIHYGLHFIFPILIAIWFDKKQWLKVYLILLTTMLIDLDHLIANPIFDPKRCSIDFHPLHTYWAIGLYLLALLHKKTRIIAIGLLFHIITDFIDCKIQL